MRDRGRARAALALVLTLTLAACAGGGEPIPRAWMSVEVLPNGDAVISLDAPPGDQTAGAVLVEAAGSLFPDGIADAPQRLGVSAGSRMSIAVTGAVEPGAAPWFVANATALGQPVASTLGAVEVCVPAVDVQVEVSQGEAPVFTDGCYVVMPGATVRFTLRPEGWRLPAAMLGAIAALSLAVLAWRSRPSRAPWVAGGCLLVIVATILAASDGATAALLAGTAGPVVPAWLVSRLALAAAAILAIVAWVRAVRSPPIPIEA